MGTWLPLDPAGCLYYCAPRPPAACITFNLCLPSHQFTSCSLEDYVNSNYYIYRLSQWFSLQLVAAAENICVFFKHVYFMTFYLTRCSKLQFCSHGHNDGHVLAFISRGVLTGLVSRDQPRKCFLHCKRSI